ncbi:Ion channel [Sanguibacter gelidistatuariae]|uniref:Ion channel n=1 Tax=Sanguibacter gelidistatuariae TaxID=1814289 RepID=A0A1G6K4N5_9MICO|nr:potassium channel family protein [Sanguibacter gelidistatuariae]SDC25801.1 Ion channel [Sanguibacter gelidistatuariae]
MDTPGARSIAQELTAFWVRTLLMIVLLTTCYYVLPDNGPFDDRAAGLRTGGSLLALVGFALVLRIQVRVIRRRPSVWGRSEALLTVLYLLILAFAITYDRMAGSAGNQIEGISNRTDALYFTVTVVSTVGFGDIHAVSTAARAVVTIQMLVNVFFVGAALRLLTGLGGSGKGGGSGTDGDARGPGAP